jgi:hypothetical protein
VFRPLVCGIEDCGENGFRVFGCTGVNWNWFRSLVCGIEDCGENGFRVFGCTGVNWNWLSAALAEDKSDGRAESTIVAAKIIDATAAITTGIARHLYFVFNC